MSEPLVLAIDTATTRIVVATGTTSGMVHASASEPAGYRHGETLLPTIERVIGDGDRRTHTPIAGIIVGIGPGAFTGLRVGIATAKGLAHGFGRPIVGVSTAAALLAAAVAHEGIAIERLILLLPAGPSDRILVRSGDGARLLPAGDEPDVGRDDQLVAVDLAGRAPEDAVARGDRAAEGLAERLVEIGAARLRVGDIDDLAHLVPEYVTLPRGAGPPVGEMTWSRDPR